LVLDFVERYGDRVAISARAKGERPDTCEAYLIVGYPRVGKTRPT
jgi:hypothetical protein